MPFHKLKIKKIFFKKADAFSCTVENTVAFHKT